MQYEITKEDLLGDFPYSMVLQNRYGAKLAYRYAYSRIEYIKKKFKMGKIGVEQSIEQINTIIIDTKTKFPQDFNTIGWADKRERRKSLQNSQSYFITIVDLVEDSLPLSDIFLNDYIEGFSYDTFKCPKSGYARSLLIMYTDFRKNIRGYIGKKLLKNGPPDLYKINREIYALVGEYRLRYNYLFTKF